ncbi:MAG: M1 family metallopeptidase [Acidobacteriota bacterium]
MRQATWAAGVFWLAAVLAAGPVRAAEGPPVLFAEPLSKRVVAYRMEASWDPGAKVIRGAETLQWTNTTSNPTAEAWFHLYPNAFSNSETVFMQESRGGHRGFRAGGDSWGYCRLLSLEVSVGDGPQASPKAEYPGEDRTVMRVALPEAVPPGGTATFQIAFETKLPRVFARSGYAGEFVMAGQWFPKIAVFEGERGWNCHAYHLNSEFYADFGVYDVSVTVPKEFVVGATGVLWKEEARGGDKRLFFHAEDVHDFAWTASPRFRVLEDQWKGVKIRVLVQRGNTRQGRRYLEAVRGALEGFERLLWKYPYPAITVVDPPRGGLGAGGMEYPMLITAMSTPLVPEEVLLPEMVVIHEFGHQYWYGMSANNEFEEAWLDEGINSYYEQRILDDLYGRERSLLRGLFGWHMGDGDSHRLAYLSMPLADPVVRYSFRYAGNHSYSVITYDKSTLVLRTLEHRLGREKMDAVMRAYFSRVRFTHPTTEDFLRIVSEEAGEDLRPFLSPLLFGTGTVDFSVLSVRNRKVSPPKGYDLSKEPPALYPKAAPEKKSQGKEDGGRWSSEVMVLREGQLILPVTVRVHFADGTKRDLFWDGGGRRKTFSFPGGPKVVKVEVDPEGKVPLDLNRFNNGWMEKADRAPASALAGRMCLVYQGLFAFLASAL